MKAATDCTAIAAINWRDTRSSCCGQHFLFIYLKSVCNQCDKQNGID